jgi:hypothetical protein
MHGQDDDSNLRVLGLYDPGGIDAVENRHADIHQYDIRLQILDSLNSSISIPCLSNDLHDGFFFKHVADHPSVQRTVVHNNNTNRCSCHKDRPQKNGYHVEEVSLSPTIVGIHGVKTVFVRPDGVQKYRNDQLACCRNCQKKERQGTGQAPVLQGYEDSVGSSCW